MTHAIGIDVGTTNTKVVLIDDRGRTVGSASRPLTTSTRDEVSEQDAEEMWTAVATAVAEVLAAAPNAASDIGAIGVCSQYSSIIGVDAQARPVGPTLMWIDTRGTDLCWSIMERHPEAFTTWIERHGIPPIGSGLSLAHLLHRQVDEPERHAATTKYLEPMDYIVARLTGRLVATQATMFASQLCDNRTVGTTSYDAELVAMSGVDASRLPELIEVDGVVGEVRAELADELGLPAGVVVHAAMNDSHAGAFATGAFADHRVGLMIGTTAVLLDTIDHAAVDLDHEVVSMPAPVPGRYLVWAENGVAGRSVEHAVVALLGRSLDDLDAVLAATSAGANGALFLPWMAGSLSPAANRSMRGGYLNIGLETTQDDLVRAAVEGTARNLRWLLPYVEAFSGRVPEEIVFGGGAARSPQWAQVIADVLARPVAVLDQPDCAVAAAVARVALARHDGADPLADEPTVSMRLEPDPATAGVHDELQAQFEAAFPATQAICEALNRS